MNENQRLAIQALENMRGDDLYRAQCAFRGLDESQMQEQHGQSGRTRAEVLAGYESHNTRCRAAIEWLKSL